MPHPLIAGNWKMNLNREQSLDLARAVAEASCDIGHAEIVICPPSVYIEPVHHVISGAPVGLGAQNMHHEAAGAFTGEVSAEMLVDVGCTHVILGHSERRQWFHETDEDVFQKTVAALRAGLTPIVCLGERLDDRDAGRTEEVIRRQFHGSLAGLDVDQAAKVVIAYEPVWAIGTGKVATPEQAEAVHSDLRKMLNERYNAEAAQAVRILYGGSVKPENAAQLLAQPNVDGALVGGASLVAAQFLAIVAGAAGT